MRNTIKINQTELRPVPTQRLNVKDQRILIRRGMYYKIFENEKYAHKYQINDCKYPVVYRIVKVNKNKFNLVPVEWFNNYRGYLGYDFEPIYGEIL